MRLLDDTIKFLLCFATSLERGLQIAHASLAFIQSSPVLAWWEVCSQVTTSLSPAPSWTMGRCGSSLQARLAGAVYIPKSSRHGLQSRHPFCHQHLFSLLLENHSHTSSWFVWFEGDCVDQAWVCGQGQPIRVSHSPRHREMVRNAHMTQSESMRM